MSLHARNLLMPVNNLCQVPPYNVSPYVLLCVNTSKTLVDVYHNVRHVQCPKCVPFTSLCKLLLISSIFLCDRYTQFLLRFCLIRFPLLSLRNLLQFVIYVALSLYLY